MSKLLSKKQVRAIVLYSFAHIDRLEKAGLFPKRIRLGQARVGWFEHEIEDWVRQKADARSLTGAII